MPTLRIGLYGDVDLNILDGSAIWLASLAEVLRTHPRVELTVLLKAAERRGVITDGLRDLPGLRLVRPAGAPERLDQRAAVRALVDLDRVDRFDAVILRGRVVAGEAARSPMAGRLWTYLTDIPQAAAEVTPQVHSDVTEVVAASHRVLAQTEELRSFLEGTWSAARGKTLLLPPMVPPDFASPARDDDGSDDDEPLRLFYAGKFAPMWGFLEAVAAFRRLRAEVPSLEFHVVGDKIHDPVDDPDFKPQVEEALASGDGLVWHGGVPREQVATLLRLADVALSARDRRMSDSLELSTKLLEYGASGVPVVMNRTTMHERLYGEDYPLYVDELADLDRTLEHAVTSAEVRRTARRRVTQVAADFSFTAIGSQIAPHLERLAPTPRARRTRVLVAGHDLKFFAGIRDHLERSGAELRVDQWSGHKRHDEPSSRDALAWADVIVCEWSLGNAVWYAQRRREGQRLVVRFHRQELETEFPGRLAVDAVDEMVFVSDRVRREAIQRFDWHDVATSVVHNAVDTLALDRPKLPGAAHRLAMIGTIPSLKGLARALDVLVELRRHDDRYRLSLAGPLPWSKQWVWSRASERQYFATQLDRIRSHRLLQNAVGFDGHVGDVGGWLRKVGVILSMSDLESFHLGLAEGMASGSAPVIRPWAGADELYPQHWIHDSSEDAAAWLLNNADHVPAVGAAASRHIRDHYAVDDLHQRWTSLILG